MITDNNTSLKIVDTKSFILIGDKYIVCREAMNVWVEHANDMNKLL